MTTVCVHLETMQSFTLPEHFRQRFEAIMEPL
jgi:acyl-CoA thioesterase FadM